MVEPGRPNVIWILGDQHPWHALGCNGNLDVVTPNIDAIAAAGVNFVNAVSGFSLCCPFRGSLLTGKYPHEVVPGHQFPMDPAGRTIAHAFNDAGYDTAYFGKWHLDGFQEHLGNVSKHIISPHRRGGFKHWVGYETDCLADLLIENLAGDWAAPFFAVLSVQPPTIRTSPPMRTWRDISTWTPSRRHPCTSGRTCPRSSGSGMLSPGTWRARTP